MTSIKQFKRKIEKLNLDIFDELQPKFLSIIKPAVTNKAQKLTDYKHHSLFDSAPPQNYQPLCDDPSQTQDLAPQLVKNKSKSNLEMRGGYTNIRKRCCKNSKLDLVVECDSEITIKELVQSCTAQRAEQMDNIFKQVEEPKVIEELKPERQNVYQWKRVPIYSTVDEIEFVECFDLY
ncbi:Hypothetical_protein [Hexamita inflata]|uniref:Hypothetical_protein n=1 Tax=Hexamita inflata TaxID=28002 RepID=A0AA86UPK9_9EUKA|nr:Hypothetical protein HINF_LOCUS47101 [Hexamita inflata]